MFIFTTAFLCGDILFQQLHILPSLWWLGIIFLLCLIFYKIKQIFLLGLCCGIAYCLWYAHHQLNWVLDNNIEGKPVILRGYIASIPASDLYGSHFLFLPKNINNNIINNKFLIQLNWQNKNNQKLTVGDRWQWMAKLKKIHGTYNPGAFDYEAYAFENHIRARGTIVDFNAQKLHGIDRKYLLDRFRQHLIEKINHVLQKSETSHWIIALITGERSNIPEEQWAILRNTGTNHLMAIAGLHIGCISGLAYLFWNFLWRRCGRVALFVPAQISATLFATFVGLIYGALAGFSLPTMRACIMMIIVALTIFYRRNCSAIGIWSAALLLVLLINPLEILSESIWLSFSAVLMIIYSMQGRLSPKGLWWHYGRLQWSISLSLIPLGIWLFHQYSFISFIANAIAIPVTAFLIVPLCLLGCVFLWINLHVAKLLLLFADKILHYLWHILVALSNLPYAHWNLAPMSIFAVMGATIGIILLLAPAGTPGKLLGVCWILPLFLTLPHPVPNNTLKLTVLDVGQGLASVIQTAHHTLIYDTGPKLGSRADAGENIVTPFLETLHIKKIDMMIISHGDNDHSGGAQAIAAHYPIQIIKTSDLQRVKLPNTSLCLRGESWDWDGIHFSFIYPPTDKLNLDNDSSCVLQITDSDKKILLVGDIEKMPENYLLTEEGDHLQSNILIAPHHGSKTSGVKKFIEAVQPQYTIFAVGYRNRFHFPNPAVVELYKTMGSQTFETMATGALTFELIPRKKIEVFLYRQLAGKYWNQLI